MNSNTFCSTKKYSDTKWEEFKAKDTMGTYEIKKYHYLILMTKDLF